MSKSLTQDEVDALPDGTQVVVTWSGGNGPHRYTIGVKDGVRYALLPPMGWRELADPDRRFDYWSQLTMCGEHPQTQVWLPLQPQPSERVDDAADGENDKGRP